MGPHTEPDESDGDAGEHDERVSEQGLAAERRQDLGDDAHGWQDQDVDLGVAEDPEEVLPEQRVTPRLRRIEQRTEITVEEHLEQADRHRGKREDQQESDNQHHPHEHRHPQHRHAGSAHQENGGNEIGRRCDRGDAEQQEADDPEVHPHDFHQLGRKRRVPDPCAIRGAAQQERRIDEDARGEEEPVAERVEPRESDIPRSDQQREHVIREGCGSRHDHEEHHREPVHRKELVVCLSAQDLEVRPGELQPDEQRLYAADDEKHQGSDAVEHADPFVVDGGDPPPYAPGTGVGLDSWRLSRYRHACSLPVAARPDTLTPNSATGSRRRQSQVRPGCSPASRAYASADPLLPLPGRGRSCAQEPSA